VNIRPIAICDLLKSWSRGRLALEFQEGAQQVVLTDWGLLEPILDAMLSTSYAFASSIKLPSLQYESLAQGSEQVAVLVMSTHAEPTTEASTLRRWSLDVSPPKPEPKTSSNFIDLKSTELHLAQSCQLHKTSLRISSPGATS
ncbi:hypothetical protein CYMTET_9148, partial [Cymbomonas tetramitiformis]